MKEAKALFDVGDDESVYVSKPDYRDFNSYVGDITDRYDTYYTCPEHLKEYLIKPVMRFDLNREFRGSGICYETLDRLIKWAFRMENIDNEKYVMFYQWKEE